MCNIYLTRLANRVNRFKFNANNERSSDRETERDRERYRDNTRRLEPHNACVCVIIHTFLFR